MDDGTTHALLREIIDNQQLLFKKIETIEYQIKSMATCPPISTKKPFIIKRSSIKKTHMVSDIHTLPIDRPNLKHINVAFFSSLEFTFFILLLETVLQADKITKAVYDEATLCDHGYSIDIPTQLDHIKNWLSDNDAIKNTLPFKKQFSIDVDYRGKTNPLLVFFQQQWCSTAYKARLTKLYESFCIGMIKQFGVWQNKYLNEIECNKLPKGLDYNECVLKIMGTSCDARSVSRSIDTVCKYIHFIVD